MYNNKNVNIILLQQDQHVINKAFQEHPVERAAMKNKTGRVCVAGFFINENIALGLETLHRRLWITI